MIRYVIVIGLIVNKMIDYHGQNERIRQLIIILHRINVQLDRITIEIFDNRFHSNNNSSSNNNNNNTLKINSSNNNSNSNDQVVDNFIKHNLLNQNHHEKQQFHFFNQHLHQMHQHNTHVINHYPVLNQAQSELEVNYLLIFKILSFCFPCRRRSGSRTR